MVDGRTTAFCNFIQHASRLPIRVSRKPTRKDGILVLNVYFCAESIRTKGSLR